MRAAVCMTIRLKRYLFCLSIVAVLAISSPATAVESVPAALIPQEAGAAAPADCWYMPGACTAGTSVALTEPIEGPVAPAWMFRPQEGEIASEPLVWNNRIALEILTAEGTRELHLHDLLTGRALCPPIEAGRSPPLAPVMWGNLILLRYQGTQLRAYRVGSGGMEEIWSRSSDKPFTAPLLFESEVFVGAGESFMRLDLLGGTRPVWLDTAGSKWCFYGRPAMRGDHVYVVGYNSLGQACLVQYDRNEGSRINSFPVENFTGFRPGPYDEIRISVLDREVVVHYPRPPALINGREAKHFGQERLPGPAETTNLYHMWIRHEVAAAEWRAGWIGFVDDPDNGPMWLAKEDSLSESALILSSRTHHRELLAGAVAPSVARGTAYLGAMAVDLDTRRILWQQPYAPKYRAVPARESVLIVGGSGTIFCLRNRSPSAARSVPSISDRNWKSGRAVLRDGTVLIGDLEIRGADAQLVRKGRIGTWPMDQVLMAETRQMEILYAADPAHAVWGIGFLIDKLLSAGYADLADQACRSGDPEVIRRVLSRAVMHGSLSRKALEEKLAVLERARARPKIADRDMAQKVLSRERALENLPADAYWIRARRLAESQPELAAALLRAALEIDPAHAGAAEEVRSMIPSEIRMPSSTDTLEWLALVEVLIQEPIKVVTPSTGGRKTPAQERLAEARRKWRPDLQAFQSRHLLIVTPFASPGAAARCLSLGELICGALDEIVPKDALPYKLEEPLLLYLYESQEEYLRESEGETGEDNAGLEWTAGHYSLNENLSRIYIPDRDEAGGDAINDVLRTYAHELTHHWLAVRASGGRLSGEILKQKGYWLVEGFASFVEEFRFDTRARKYNPYNPRASRLDLVANARPDQFIDWNTVFGTSALAFQNVNMQTSVIIPSTWHLGARKIVGPRHLFYNQAAAACHYAYHAADGRLRGLLLRALQDFYLGRDDRLEISDLFGVSAEELGGRIVRYAREVQRRARR